MNGFKKNKISDFVYNNVFSCCARREVFDLYLKELDMFRKGRYKASASHVVCDHFKGKVFVEQRKSYALG